MATARARAASRSLVAPDARRRVREPGGQVERRQAEAWVAHDRQSSVRAPWSPWTLPLAPAVRRWSLRCRMADPVEPTRRAAPPPSAVRPLSGSPSRRACDAAATGPRSAAASPSRRSAGSSARPRSRCSAASLTVTAGLVVVAAATGWAVGAVLPGRPRTAVMLALVAVGARPARPVGVCPVARAGSSDRSTCCGRSTAGSSRSSSLAAAVVAWIAAPMSVELAVPPARGGRPPPPRRHGSTTGGAGDASIRCSCASGSSISPGRRGSSRTRTASSSASWSASSAPTTRTVPTSTWSGPARITGGTASGRLLYERFFDDVSKRGVRQVNAVTWPGNRVSVAFHRAMGFTVDDGPGTPAPVRHAGLPRLRSRRRRPGGVQPGALIAPTAAGVSCSWSSRPKRAARSGSGTASTQRESSASPSA